MATIRRASHQLPGIDPRSPMSLTIPQHQILTSFQSLPSPFHQTPSPFQAASTTSPFSHTPSAFTFRGPTRVPTNTPSSPISRTAQLLYDVAPSPVKAQNRDQSSSLKFLLQTGRVPSILSSCPCGQGRQTTKHILESCPHFANERETLLPARNPRSPGAKSPRTPKGVKKSPVLNAARKWRMRTLLGRYRRAVQIQEGFGNPMLAAGKKMQKSPRPDVVELGLVGGDRLKERLERGVRQFI